MVALIPARAGSKRIPDKNVKLLGGKPLLLYTIEAAKASGTFKQIIVSTEDERAGQIALSAGVRWLWRPPELSADHVADIAWIRQVLRDMGSRPWTFAILRPTSPFRTAQTIQRAFKAFTICDGTHDSLRAVERVKQHPGKMFSWEGPGYPIVPIFSGKRSDGVPWHSSPTQTLPAFYVQNSSLEMAYTANVEAHGNIHGRKIIPFFTEGFEGFSIDYEGDFERAEEILARGLATLPKIQGTIHGAGKSPARQDAMLDVDSGGQ